MFQIKNFASIVASMINYMQVTTNKITDYTVGSIARTLIEAPAIEIDQLYQEMYNGLQDAIPVATYNSFDFTLLPSLSTNGNVTVNITAQGANVLIPAGTVFSFPGGATTYAGIADTTILASNTTIPILVSATTPGALGNIPATTQFTLVPSPAGFVSASNAAAFTNGLDPETEAQRKVRFQNYIATLQHGTGASIIYGLKQTTILTNGVVTERVATAAIIEPYVLDPFLPAALINAYIHNGVGSTSGALVTAAQAVVNGSYDVNGNPIPGWKAAGVVCTVAAATELPLNVAGQVTAAPGYVEATLATAAQGVISNYVIGINQGASFEVAALYAAVMAIAGVSNFVPDPLAAPAAPTLGSSAAGALGGATYYAKATYLNSKGETLPSAEHSFAVSASHVLTVASPAALTGATGWNVYVSTTAGTETLQNASPIAIGTNYTEPTSGLVTGAALPALSTAALADVTSTASQKLMPGTIAIR